MTGFFRAIYSFVNKDRTIENFARKKKATIYGAQSVKKQTGFIGRNTFDWDISINNPRHNARELEQDFDREAGGNYYYTKTAQHPGTYKVIFIGMDEKPNTNDDIPIADLTRTRPLKTVNIQGVRYATLSETISDKQKALKDRAYAFRHEKDREDLQRIRLAKQTFRR